MATNNRKSFNSRKPGLTENQIIYVETKNDSLSTSPAEIHTHRNIEKEVDLSTPAQATVTSKMGTNHAVIHDDKLSNTKGVILETPSPKPKVPAPPKLSREIKDKKSANIDNIAINPPIPITPPSPQGPSAEHMLVFTTTSSSTSNNIVTYDDINPQAMPSSPVPSIRHETTLREIKSNELPNDAANAKSTNRRLGLGGGAKACCSIS